MHRKAWPYLAVAAALAAALVTAVATAGDGTHGNTSVVVYDTFQKPGGYTLADYAQKWSNPYGLLEMGLTDTRNFAGGAFHVSAAPFHVGADFSVFDHLKYIAVSNQSFAVPPNGSVTFSSEITAATPGTIAGRVVHGTYTATGAPWSATALQGQQAGAVMNMIDFCTGQLFDWFVAGNTAFALVERLPTNVTGNTAIPGCGFVGRDKMYTQIVRELPVAPGVSHAVSIRYSDSGRVEFFLDGRRVAKVKHVGVPLDRQGVDYTGIYPSLGPGEELAGKIHSFVIGHGLFSLLDAFPFQHPDAPELSVSVPMSERLFGQGAIAAFDEFVVSTKDRADDDD